MTKFDAKNLVDRLGEIRAEEKVLKDEAKNIEAVLKASGDARFEGDYFVATISRFEKATTAWKKIIEDTKTEFTDYVGNKHTKVSDVCTVKVTAHAK